MLRWFFFLNQMLVGLSVKIQPQFSCWYKSKWEHEKERKRGKASKQEKKEEEGEREGGKEGGRRKEGRKDGLIHTLRVYALIHLDLGLMGIVKEHRCWFLGTLMFERPRKFSGNPRRASTFNRSLPCTSKEGICAWPPDPCACSEGRLVSASFNLTHSWTKGKKHFSLTTLTTQCLKFLLLWFYFTEIYDWETWWVTSMDRWFFSFILMTQELALTSIRKGPRALEPNNTGSLNFLDRPSKLIRYMYISFNNLILWERMCDVLVHMN